MNHFLELYRPFQLHSPSLRIDVNELNQLLNRAVFFSWLPVNRGRGINISCEV